MYLSTARVAFCSDLPLSYEAAGGDRTEWSYYKVRYPARSELMRCVWLSEPSTDGADPRRWRSL